MLTHMLHVSSVVKNGHLAVVAHLGEGGEIIFLFGGWWVGGATNFVGEVRVRGENGEILFDRLSWDRGSDSDCACNGSRVFHQGTKSCQELN